MNSMTMSNWPRGYPARSGMPWASMIDPTKLSELFALPKVNLVLHHGHGPAIERFATRAAAVVSHGRNPDVRGVTAVGDPIRYYSYA